LSDAIARLSQLREELKSAIDADAASYDAVVQAYKAAKDSAGKNGAVNAALRNATNVPLAVAERAREVSRITESLRGMTNPKMASDLTVAKALATAAMEGAIANVEINLESLQAEEPMFAEEVKEKVAGLKSGH
jgi:glutamate formiminotransferase/formiminotetrahydrofolate cyclodeaminase